MKQDEKKEWIIKYAKNNNLEDVLAEKYSNKKNKVGFFKRYSNEIQSICSILSVVVIGIISLFIAVQNNKLVEMQNQIMRSEQKPIIDILINQSTETQEKLVVINKSKSALSYDVEVIPYIDVFCNENNWGSTPIRAYLFKSKALVSQIDNNKEEDISEISLLSENSNIYSSIEKKLHEITSNYNNLAWDFCLKYLIRIISIDALDEKNVDYFIFSRNTVHRIELEKGNSVFDECNYMIDNLDGSKTSRESYFDIDNLDTKVLFKYILKKIRDKDLYEISYETNQKYLYGEYEPKLMGEGD